jgi:hypothetical protein
MRASSRRAGVGFLSLCVAATLLAAASKSIAAPDDPEPTEHPTAAATGTSERPRPKL